MVLSIVKIEMLRLATLLGPERASFLVLGFILGADYRVDPRVNSTNKGLVELLKIVCNHVLRTTLD